MNIDTKLANPLSLLNMKQVVFYTLIALLPALAFAEIETITVHWDTGHCDERCVSSLNRALSKMSGAAEVVTEAQNPVATIYWRAEKTFSYRKLERAVKSAQGIEIKKIQMLIRGTIVEKDGKVFLTSIGDQTEFRLIKDPEPSTTQYVERYSIYNRNLDDEQRQELVEAQKKGMVITVDGILFQPERPPLNLVIGAVTYPKRP